MAKQTNTSVQVYLDFNPNQASAQQCQATIDKLKKSLTEMEEAGEGNTAASKELEKQIAKEEAALNKYNDKVERTKSVLNDLSGATYNELLAQKKALQKELNNLVKGTDQYNAVSEQLNRVTAQMATNTQASTGKLGQLMTSMRGAPGIVGLMTNSIYGAVAACKAFIANPIGAILAAIAAVIGLCVAGFKKFAGASEEGALKSAKSLAPLKVIATELGKALKWVGEMVANLLTVFTGMIYKVVGLLAKVAPDMFGPIYDNMTRQYQIEEDMYRLNKEKQSLIVKEKQYQQELLDLKLKTMQKDKYSLEERNKFIDEYINKEQELTDMKVKRAEEEYALWEKQSAQDDNTLEDNMKGAELAAAITDAKIQQQQSLMSIERRRQSMVNEMNGTEKQVTSTVVDENKKRTENTIKSIDREVEERKRLLDWVKMNEDMRAKMIEDLDYQSWLKKLELIDLEESERKRLEDNVYNYKLKRYKETQALDNTTLKSTISNAKSLLDQEISGMVSNLKKTSDAQTQFTIDSFNAKKQLFSGDLKLQHEADMQALNDLLSRKLITEEDYQKAKRNLELEYAAGEIQQKMQVVGALKQLTQSLQESELQSLDSKREKELAAAGDDAEKKAEIERKYEEDKLELQKKYADVNFAIKVAEIIGNTAVAVMTAIAQLGPIAGGIAAGLITANGAVQIGIANKERERIKSMTLDGAGDGKAQSAKRIVKDGFFRGGYTGDGDPTEEAGPAHKREYIIPARMLGDSRVMNTAAALEAIRTGRADASILNQQKTVIVQSGAAESSNIVNNEMLSLLRDLRDNGIGASVMLSDIERKQELQERGRFKRKKG